MGKKHFWFKFEWDKWRNDPSLRRCNKEAKGFWIDAIAAMEELDTYFLEGTPEDLCRDLVCTMDEFERSIAELKRTGAATISKSQGRVKVVSRKLLKEVNLTEYNRLKQQESRKKRRVKNMSRPISKIELRDKKEEEEIRERTATPPSPPDPPDDTRHEHPAIVAIREVSGKYPPKNTWDEIIGLMGVNVDVVRLKKCFVQWQIRGYKPVNYGWATDWYANDHIPEQGKGNGTNRRNNSGNYEPRPTPASVIAGRRYRRDPSG